MSFSRADELKKEIFRKSIHLVSAIIPTLLCINFYFILFSLAGVAIFYSICEFLRMKHIRVPVVTQVTELAARKRDENKFVAGPVTLVCGILLAAIFLEPTAARIGIYALSFGDGLASLVGKFCGRVKIPLTAGKTLEGSLACFLAVLLTSFLVCRNIKYAFILALAAMLIEVLPLADFDNVVIPIAIGSIYQFLLV